MLKWVLTGGAIPFLLGICGVFFLFYLRFYPFRAPKRMLGALRPQEKNGGISASRALMQALAGTLGVGNIVGVANALVVGGAGAIFWMWISALVAMVLKYAEILLAVAHRRRDADGAYRGGAYYYIKDHFCARGFYRTAILLSSVFAALMVLDALSMGCVIQVRAMATALGSVSTVPMPLFGALLLFITLPFLIKGSRGISALTEYLVPVMTVGYILLSIAILWLRRAWLGDALLSIFSSAFDAQSLGGGILGCFTSRALRVGTMRGLLSNEAGCGTSPTAHATATTQSPASQGVWGIFEVFVDTILLCTLTALAVLVSVPEGMIAGADGFSLAMEAYGFVLGGFAKWFFAAAMLCFGYATLICWGGYGMESVRFLSPKRRWRVLYVLAFACCIFFGIGAAPDAVWLISDFSIAALTSINLLLLFLMRREIRAHTFAWKNELPLLQ